MNQLMNNFFFFFIRINNTMSDTFEVCSKIQDDEMDNNNIILRNRFFF